MSLITHYINTTSSPHIVVEKHEFEFKKNKIKKKKYKQWDAKNNGEHGENINFSLSEMSFDYILCPICGLEIRISRKKYRDIYNNLSYEEAKAKGYKR